MSTLVARALPSVPTFVFPHNWVRQVRVRTSYLTDLVEARRNEGPDTNSLLSRPSRTISVQLDGFSQAAASKLIQTIEQYGKTPQPFPLYSDFVRPTAIASIGGGVSEITGDFRFRRFFVGQRVYYQEPQAGVLMGQFGLRVGIITERTSTYIRVTNFALPNTAKVGGYLYPCIDAEAVVASAGEWDTGQIVSFQVDAVEAIGQSTLPGTSPTGIGVDTDFSLIFPAVYRNDRAIVTPYGTSDRIHDPAVADDPPTAPTIFPPHDWTVPVQHRILRDFSNERTGKASLLSFPHDRTRSAFGFQMRSQKREDFWNLLVLFDQARGRHRPMSMPLPTEEQFPLFTPGGIRPGNDPLGQVILLDVEGDFSSFTGPKPRYQYVAFNSRNTENEAIDRNQGSPPSFSVRKILIASPDVGSGGIFLFLEGADYATAPVTPTPPIFFDTRVFAQTDSWRVDPILFVHFANDTLEEVWDSDELCSIDYELEEHFPERTTVIENLETFEPGQLPFESLNGVSADYIFSPRTNSFSFWRANAPFEDGPWAIKAFPKPDRQSSVIRTYDIRATLPARVSDFAAHTDENTPVQLSSLCLETEMFTAGKLPRLLQSEDPRVRGAGPYLFNAVMRPKFLDTVYQGSQPGLWDPVTGGMTLVLVTTPGYVDNTVDSRDVVKAIKDGGSAAFRWTDRLVNPGSGDFLARFVVDELLGSQLFVDFRSFGDRSLPDSPRMYVIRMAVGQRIQVYINGELDAQSASNLAAPPVAPVTGFTQSDWFEAFDSGEASTLTRAEYTELDNNAMLFYVAGYPTRISNEDLNAMGLAFSSIYKFSWTPVV